jgi:type IV pilus assembly protein PilM
MRSVIGIHIDTSFINAAQIDDHKGQAKLIKTAVEEIKLKDRPDTDASISSAIKTVLSKFPVGHASIVCTFHDPQIFVRKVTTPPMPVQELGPAVQLAVKNAFPFSLDEAVLDFQLVNKFSYQDKERYNVLVAVAPRKTIERIQTLFLNAKIKLSSCIPAAIALENLIARTRMKADETLAVIILGATVTELAIYQNSRLEFSRKLSIAVEDIIKSMTGSFYSDTGKTELTFAEAQEIEKEFGIPKTDEPIEISAKISTEQVLMLIGPKIEQLATEINRSIDYYRAELQGAKVDRVLLVGEVSRLKRLDEYLSEQLGLDVKCGNLLEGIGTTDQKPLLAVAAALGGTQGINLLSKPTRKIEPVILKAFVIAIILVIGGVYLYLNDRINARSEEVGLHNQKFTAKLTEAYDIRRLKEGRPAWDENLKVFSQMPSSIYLDELYLSDNQLHIKGEVLGEGHDPKSTLAGFITSLQKTSLKNARLKSLKRNKDEADKFEFEIIAAIEAVKQ